MPPYKRTVAAARPVRARCERHRDSDLDTPSTARRTLHKARFFLARATETGIGDRDAFVTYLEAAIVFARSVAHHLGREFTGRNRTWCKARFARLDQHPLFAFLRDVRNFILKKGPLGVRRVVSVAMSVPMILSESFDVRVIRGKPWYKRNPRTPWEDFSRDAIRPLRRYLEQRRERRRIAAIRRRAEQTTDTTTTDNLYFATDDPAWTDRPALDIVRDYLDMLEAVVEEFEAHFGERGI